MENLNLDYSNIFNLTKKDILSASESESKQDLYFSPLPVDGKPYIAKVRFLPYIYGEQKAIAPSIKYFCKYDPTDSKFNGYCPSSVGKPSILRDAWYMLNSSKNVLEKELTNNLKNGKRFVSAVYVIEDKNNPDNNNKILFWDYGKQVHDKIVALLEPDFGDEVNVFDLLSGYEMGVKVEKKGENNNYDNCSFIQRVVPFSTPTFTFDGSKESQVKVIEFFKENMSDKRHEYTFKEWTDGTWEAALKYLDDLIPNTIIKAKLWKKHGYDYNTWSAGGIQTIDQTSTAETIMTEATTSGNSGNTQISRNDQSMIDSL